MITVKSNEEISTMKKCGLVLRDVLKLLEDNIKIGITTKQLDSIAYKYITKHKGKPSFLNYNGFPASICTSIDEVIVHGIPEERRLEEGQIIGIDAGVFLDGFHTDAARTFPVGKVSPVKEKLIATARQAFFNGVSILKEGVRLGDLGSVIQSTVEKEGFSVVRDMVGHGIGEKLHEDPSVPNYGTLGRGLRLKSGMTLAIEPMINEGVFQLIWKEDGWTVVTADGKPSAHYENTVVITKEGYEIITL